MGWIHDVCSFWLSMTKEIIEDGWLHFDPHFLSNEEADILFHTLETTLPWAQGSVTLFGKTYPTPRLESLHVRGNKSYSYSGNTLHQHPFTPELLALKAKIDALVGVQFNCVLANFYRDGKDSNGWHADNERELGKNPIIASISFGCARRFDLKHSTTSERKQLMLTHGSLLIMGGSMQHHWKHCIAKSTKIIGPRINLTFRILV
jgi:alkylated DNA repair dioxygenase AlkB